MQRCRRPACAVSSGLAATGLPSALAGGPWVAKVGRRRGWGTLNRHSTTAARSGGLDHDQERDAKHCGTLQPRFSGA